MSDLELCGSERDGFRCIRPALHLSDEHRSKRLSWPVLLVVAGTSQALPQEHLNADYASIAAGCMPRPACSHCGKPAGPRAGQRGGKPYCSAACRSAAWNEAHPRKGRGPKRRPRPCRGSRVDLYLGALGKDTLHRYAEGWGYKTLSAALRAILEDVRHDEVQRRAHEATVAGGGA